MAQVLGFLHLTSNLTQMNNVISLKEHLLKKDLDRATKELETLRILISSGQHGLVVQAKALEEIIAQIEQELIHMTENDLLF